MSTLLEEDLCIEFPKLIRVTQKFDRLQIEDLDAAVRKQLEREEISGRIIAGQKIAIAIGSRGIHNLDKIVKLLIVFLKEQGVDPFIVTAMGSHGGANAEGQKRILSSYGITDQTMGVPVISSLSVEVMGKVKSGHTVYYDKAALSADMTILINRIKPHTDFVGEIESGLCKMAVIGLGNHKGCSAMHRTTPEVFSQAIEESAKFLFQKANIGFGLGIVENPYEQTMLVEAIPSEEIIKREKELLQLAKSKLPLIRIPEIDILIIDEIGKDISGSGADSNVIGGFGLKSTASGVPIIHWIVILDITEASHGNAIGIGLAHITTRKVLNKIDLESTYANAIACGKDFGLEISRIPLVMKDEREALAAAFKLWGSAPKQCKVVRIKNTLELETIHVSESLLPHVKAHPEWFDLGYKL